MTRREKIERNVKFSKKKHRFPQFPSEAAPHLDELVEIQKKKQEMKPPNTNKKTKKKKKKKEKKEVEPETIVAMNKCKVRNFEEQSEDSKQTKLLWETTGCS